jgi:hypothetical protein
MKKIIALFIIYHLPFIITKAQTSNASTPEQKQIIAQILKQLDYQEQMTLTQDTAAMNRYYPDDMRITNPFSMLIDKKKFLERVNANIIKYSEFEKVVEHAHIEGNYTVIVMGYEKTKASVDAPREDANKPMTRRFTEVFVKRGKEWKRIVRHAHNVN